MSVEEAREIIGEAADNMTDIQITKLVNDVDTLATIAVRVAKDELRKGKRLSILKTKDLTND